MIEDAKRLKVLAGNTMPIPRDGSASDGLDNCQEQDQPSMVPCASTISKQKP
jgi:hypothetical protein